MAVDGWKRVQVQSRGALCQNFADELRSLSRFHGAVGKRATSPVHGRFLASNKLLRLCSTLGVGDHICDCLRLRLIDPAYPSFIFSICLLFFLSISILENHFSERKFNLSSAECNLCPTYASARSLLCRCEQFTRRRSRKTHTIDCPSSTHSSTSDDCWMKCHSHGLADVEDHRRSHLQQGDHAILCDFTRLLPIPETASQNSPSARDNFKGACQHLHQRYLFRQSIFSSVRFSPVQTCNRKTPEHSVSVQCAELFDLPRAFLQ